MACYLQSGIQTQWNIGDGIFYKNSWRDVPVNNIRKKIHLIFRLRGSEFDSDLKHSDKEYIYCIRYIVLWKPLINEFKEKKPFYSEKEDSFLMSLFLFSCLFSN